MRQALFHISLLHSPQMLFFAGVPFPPAHTHTLTCVAGSYAHPSPTPSYLYAGYIHQHLNIPEEQVAGLTQELYYGYGTTLAGLRVRCHCCCCCFCCCQAYPMHALPAFDREPATPCACAASTIRGQNRLCLLHTQARGFEIDVDHFHATVHGTLDYERLLQPDPRTRELLLSMDCPRYLLTNADRAHAKVCLERLGIQDCFLEVFDYETVQELARSRGLLTPQQPLLCKPCPQVRTVPACQHACLAACQQAHTGRQLVQ